MMRALRYPDGTVLIPRSARGNGIVGDAYLPATEEEKKTWEPWTIDVEETKSLGLVTRYSDDQPRDDNGRWTDGGGSADTGASGSAGSGSAGSGSAVASPSGGASTRDPTAGKPLGFHEVFDENAGGGWEKFEKERALAEYERGNKWAGSVTYVMSGRLPVSMLKGLPGVNDEHLLPNILNDRKANDIKDSVKADGVKDAIHVRMNVKGEAYISEGNHRLALAAHYGQSTIPVYMTWHAGAEKIDNQFNAKKLIERFGKTKNPKKSVVYVEKYSEDQPRDDNGRWTDGGGSSDSGGGGGGGGGGSSSGRVSSEAGHSAVFEGKAKYDDVPPLERPWVVPLDAKVPDVNPDWRQEDSVDPPFTYPAQVHKTIRDDGLWGGSHHSSSEITGASARLMGIEGYGKWDVDRQGVYERRAEKFLQAIADDKSGSEEKLYHGFENIANVDWKVGDTLRLPLMASAGGRPGDTAGYGFRHDLAFQRGAPTVFEFAKGTPMVAYGKWGKENAKDFKAIYSEAIVAGKFRVTGTREFVSMGYHFHTPDNGPQQAAHLRVTVVSLEPVEVFDPKSGWRKNG